MSNKTATLVTAAVMVLGAIIALPSATAQGGAGAQTTFDFQVGSLPSGPVEPLVVTPFKIDYTYSYQVPLQGLAGAVGTATATFNFNCPPTVTVTGDLTRIIVVDPAGQSPVTGSASLQMVISRDAKALESLRCDVSSSVTAVNDLGLPAPPAVEKNFVVQADYFGLLEATTDLKLKQGGPQKQIPFDIQVTNFGNGQTQVNFETTERPSGRWQGLAPDQVQLDEKDGNRASTTAVYTIVTPYKNGWNNEEGAFTMKISSSYAFNPDKQGNDIFVNLVARVRGVYVPTLEPMLMLGAVIGAGMVARMLRDDEE